MRIDLNEMSQRLGKKIPHVYRTFIESNEPSRYENTLGDPAEICALNLGESDLDSSGPTAHGFLLHGEDGDFYLIRDGDNSGALYFWSHEVREISATNLDALKLIQDLAATPISEIAATSLAISRVDPWSQSILDPIRAHDLAAAVKNIPNISVFEYTEHVNPFDGSRFKMHTPGIVVDRASMGPLLLRLRRGCLHCTEAEPPLPEQVKLLAGRLSAQVFPMSVNNF